MARRGTSRAAYARAVERLWSELLGRAALLSERDWALILEWYEREIPLALLHEAADEIAERSRRGRRRAPRGLACLAPLVEEGAAAIREGRVAAPAPDERQERGRAAAERAARAWEIRARAEPEGTALRRLLERLLAAQARGADPRELDARLDRELPQLAAATDRAGAERVVDRELARRRGRMGAEILRATRERAIVERLRGTLGLPRLAAPTAGP